MESIVSQQPMTPAQIFVMQTFATTKNEQERDELTSLYLDYIQRKMDLEADKWWEENNMTADKFEERCSDLHFRTPYITK